MMHSFRTSIRRVSSLGFVGCFGLGLLAGLAGSAVPAARAHRAAEKTTATAPTWPYPDSLDALVAAPRFHRVLFENERVRVLEVTVPPHTREPPHTHRWPSVMYRERYGTGRYYDATGRVVHDFTKPAQPVGTSTPRAHWQAPEGPHSVENTGPEADRFVRVELKQ